jgi:transcriptional regulator with XRE-family HTH domain
MIEPIYPIIGRNIRALRKQHGVTQTDLAVLIGFQRPISISDIERGNMRIHVHHLAIVADLFGVPMQDLLKEEL